jgi:hypothetical protein
MDATGVAPLDARLSAVVTQRKRREGIQALEAALAHMPNAIFGDNDTCPLTHRFAGGIYVREIFIPAGMLLTGKIHRHAHPNFLMQGEALVVTEQNGQEHLVAPLAMISLPGTKRAVYAITDLRWITVHEVGAERDLAKIEAMLIAPEYAVLGLEEAICPLLP